MNIQMVDLQGQYQKIKPEIDKAIQEVLESSTYLFGEPVETFASELGRYLECHVIPCGNGTDALQVALMSLNLRPGDEIIVPSHTYVSTVEVIALLGLTAVYVDVDESTFNMNPDAVKAVISKRTKAIIPVHLYGQCAQLEPILNLAEEYEIAVIEDTAQALGADYIFSDGTKKKAGTIGRIGTTSFFPSKNLGCFGDGGAIMTRDSQLAERMKMLCDHGQKVKFQHKLVGINSRLDNIQAAVMTVKLPHLDEYIKARQQVAKFYDEHLGKLEQIELPGRTFYSSHSFHQYTIRVNNKQRDELQEFLTSHDIPTCIYYPKPVHLQEGYLHFGKNRENLLVTEKLMQSILSLPMHTELTIEELEYICDKIREFFRS
jgi:UDP-2-acetamido-2-deoxy-ribo-hexuluronate aminotransferase